MRNSRVAEISESEESEEESNLTQRSISKSLTTNNEDSSSSSSSESDESSKAPPPPIDARKRKSSTSASPKKNVTFTPLERFVDENKNLKKLDVEDVVTDEDDVCLLEIPKTIDPSEFLEKVINFDKKTKLKVNKTKYVIVPELEDLRPINLLTRKIKIVHPVSILRMRQYNKHKQESEVENEVTTPPALPDTLKVRHPLFGAEFKRKIVLDEEIQRKLDVTIDQVVKKMKKKKRKEVETSQEFVAPLEPTDSGKKKKHKKKAAESSEQDKNEGNVDESIFALLETHIKSKKGHKKTKEEPLTSSSDSGIFTQDIKSEYEDKSVQEADGDHNENKKKHRNNMREASLENENKEKRKSSISEFEHKRKHKKSVRESGNESEHEHKKKHKNSMNEVQDVEETKQKRKNSQDEFSSFYDSWEKKKKSHASLPKQELSDSHDWETSSKPEKKKKHKTSKNELSQDSSFVDSFSEDTSKKKKKHRAIKEEKFDSESGHEFEHHKRKNSTNMKQQEENDDSIKEKTSRLSLINSTVIPGVQLPLFEFDVSNIGDKDDQDHDSSKNDEEAPEEQKSHKDRRKKEASFESDTNVEKKVKKIKKERLEQSEDETSSPRKRKKNIDPEDETSSPKKKRKHVKEEVHDDDSENDFQTNSLILNLLNKVKSEMDTSVNHKKKK
ncbi:hepatoma-derived growth factor-related protein 2-like [Zophobas morio]|uniref:hepatoma-derived growth factor-related protein 2-like n=1 Tax=Zophobas morio TaxID=2755281 RepID=UPI003082E158